MPVWQYEHHLYDRTFLSKCLSKRVSASVSPPGQTADGKPSVSKPGKKKKKGKKQHNNNFETKIIFI